MSEQLTANQARQRLYEILRREESFDDKAKTALEVGTDYLPVDLAYLIRVDPTADRWTAMIRTERAATTEPTHDLDHSTIPCQRAIEEETQVAVTDMQTTDQASDHALASVDINCYLSTPLILNEEPRGTVCFAATEPREAFTETETRFAEFLTRLLERELDRKRVETDLTRQSTLTGVLDRVLRHNLRNEMSVIRGFTTELTEQTDDTSYAETIIDHVDDLIALSETARKLETIIASDAERTATDITDVVTRVAEAVDTEYPSASITVSGDTEIIAAVRPSFEQAVEELIDNAAKHAGAAPTVTITVKQLSETAEIVITDDGPGLDTQEIDVLNRGAETPLTHGSGLGLWLAHWVVTSHDGEIDATVTGDGTVMTISLPRTTATPVSNQQPAAPRPPDQYQAAVMGASDAILIVNDDACIIDANAAAGELFGRAKRQLRGQELTTFFPPRATDATTWKAIRTATDEREIIRLNTADGCERFIEYTATSDIVPGRHLLVAREVTDRIATDADQHARSATTAGSTPAVILTDPDRDDNPIVYVNEAFCELTGYKKHEVRGRNCRLLQGPDTDEDRVATIKAGIEHSEPVSVILRNYRADGTPFWNHVTITPVTTGETELFVGLQEDVTDRIDRPLSLEQPP